MTNVSGFSIVRNATTLDFPFEASIRSVLPGVDEFVLAVGLSDDDTLSRAGALAAAHPKVRLIETAWNFDLGSAVLSDQTNRAMQATSGSWGVYVQADEVFEDGGALRLRERIEEIDRRQEIEGVVVDYLHFYGSFDVVGTSRQWYRREIRAVRLDRSIHSHGDAQGFRVGNDDRRVRCVASGVTVFHYSSARPAWVLHAKREQDRAIYATERRKDPSRPLLAWFPGLRRFRGQHPAVVSDWVRDRAGQGSYVEPREFRRDHLRIWITMAVERITGWRPFEFRNYRLTR